MNRHDCFLPLSRDHHDGLLLAVRLQQGSRALLRLWSHDPQWQAEYVIRFFHDNLQEHFSIEEREVFPLADRYFPQEKNKITTRLRSEHDEMKQCIELLGRPGSEPVSSILVNFGKLLEQHIHTEEREFFPMCEQYFPGELLEQLITVIPGSHDRGNVQ